MMITILPPIQLYLHTYSLRFHLDHKPGYDVFSFIEQATREGFQGVCISANDANFRYLGTDDLGELAEIGAHVKAHGLACDIDTSHTAPDHLSHILQMAQAVGADQIRTYTRYLDKPNELITQTVEDLTAVHPIAADYGIHILLENHETFTGTEIAQTLIEVDSPWIGALYDYGNSQMVLEDPHDALTAMAPFARSAHLKDHVLLREDQSPDGRLSVLGVPLGDGNLPILDLTRRLLEAGCPRIAFENSWGYRAPVKPERQTVVKMAQLGHGAFAFPDLPDGFDARYLLHADDFPVEQLIEMEATMHTRTLGWWQTAVTESGMTFAK